jgi:hypothetical protein
LAILALLGLSFVHGLGMGTYPTWGLALGAGIPAAFVLVHVLNSAMWIGVRGQQLRWWGMFDRGAHALESCRLLQRVDAGAGRGALICVELHRGSREDELEPVELASLALSDSNRARAKRLADRLGLALEVEVDELPPPSK